MKKLALLLAALGVVSAATYAAPELTVTSIGQEVEIEHTNGTDDTTAWLFNTVKLQYDTWNFGMTAGKQWNYDDKDNNDGKGLTSINSRLQFDVAKKITDDFTLTGRYRGQKNFDRFQMGYNYNFGMFATSGDLFYDSHNGEGHDEFHAELFPIKASYGPVTLAYYLEYVKDLGGREPGEREDYIDHQLRVYATLYKGERLTLSTEGRFTFAADENWKDKDGKAVEYKHFDDLGGNNRVYLKANYAMTENLNVYANYFYQLRDYKYENSKKDNLKEYTSNVVLGWTYKF